MPGSREKSGSKKPSVRKPAVRSVPRPLPAGKPARRREATSLLDQERIALAKREWETTVDALPQFVCLLDQHGRIVRANRVVESWQLGSVGSVKNKTLHDLWCPRCTNPACPHKEMWSRMQEELATGVAVVRESDNILPGRSLRIHLRPIPLSGNRHGRNTTSSAIMVIEDITDLKRAEAILHDTNKVLEQQVRQRTTELQDINTLLRREVDEHRAVKAALLRSEERYRGLIDTMTEGLIVTDVGGQIVYVNDSFCHILGAPRHELISRGFEEFVSELPLCSDVGAGPQDSCEPCTPAVFERTWLRQDGVPVTVHVSRQRMLDHDGRYDGCFAVVMDVTERRRAEEALRRSESELRLLSAQLLVTQEQERKRIASELHDGIGQTMSAVKFYLESTAALCRSGQAPPGAEAIDKIVPKVQSAIDEVRRISMALRPSTLDDLGILATLGWFCREFQAIYGQLKLDLRLNITEEEIAEPIKTMIYRIVQEALNNVVKHAHASGASIHLAGSGDLIELLVSDDGIGFSQEAVAQRDGRRGVGLSSMRERAESTGAVFHCLSGSPRGTRIQVSWPRTPGH